MPKLSILVPSRNELYLMRTIDDCFAKAQGDVEVVTVLDGCWPDNWKEFVAKHPNLHTIHHGEPKGLRPSVNAAAASAISRGAKYLFKLDAHCMLDEGFDVKLLAEIQPNWIVVPRRKRLDPVTWTLTDTHKTDIDYHYLSFPDDPLDFGGPGLNGKVWETRAKERAEILIDEEMSSQGSAWLASADYFTQLELLDAESYGTFWNEFQEIGLKCWLSGGQVMVNKKTWYAHWHKGKSGRGYRLAESLLKQGRNYTMKWLYNEAWAGQTLPFSSLIKRFWPVPTWPENWEELVYGSKQTSGSRFISGAIGGDTGISVGEHTLVDQPDSSVSLKIHKAHYGIGSLEDIDVTDRVRYLVNDNSLDIVVNNATLTPNQNPFRGKRKQLTVTYSYDGSNESTTVTRDEKEWLIIGQAVMREGEKLLEQGRQMVAAERQKLNDAGYFAASDRLLQQPVTVVVNRPVTATALNDHLIRKFRIPDRRLRGPMPIEVREFHRDDLAVLFAELGFKRGAEIGVAEGKFSEVLLKANPDCHLLLVDPWHAYSDNPQNKTKEKNEFAYNETKRRTAPYPNVKLDMRYSMDAVRDVADGSLDWIYLDAHHGYEWIMPDLIFWSQKVRSGGIVAADDLYKLNDKWGAGPMEAFYDYTRAMRIELWWLINAHKSVDGFFVKP